MPKIVIQIFRRGIKFKAIYLFCDVFCKTFSILSIFSYRKRSISVLPYYQNLEYYLKRSAKPAKFCWQSSDNL